MVSLLGIGGIPDHKAGVNYPILLTGAFLLEALDLIMKT